MNGTEMKNTRPIWQVKKLKGKIFNHQILWYISQWCEEINVQGEAILLSNPFSQYQKSTSVLFFGEWKRGFWILSQTYAVGKSQTLKEMWNFACVHSECDLPATPSLPANTPAVLSWPLARLVSLKGCLSPWSYLTPPTRNVHLVLALPEKEKLKSHHLSLNSLCNDLNDSERQQHEATPGGLRLTRELTRKQQSNRCNKCLPVYEDAEDCHADDTEGQEVQYIS